MRQEQDRLSVLSSLAAVASTCDRVVINYDRIGPAVARWGHLLTGGSGWQHPCLYFDGTEETVRWVFTADVLNFCFWPDPGEPTWTVTYQGVPFSGYWGLAASLKRAMEGDIPVTSAHFLAEIDAEALRQVFAGEGEIPLFEERLSNLREAGRVLLSEWGGDIVRLVESCQGSAECLVRQVIASFSSFRDEASYGDRKVYFWKRAQIFPSDLHVAFGGTRWGRFDDLDCLTAFADYKLPQVLRALGVISYASELARRIDRLEPLAPGSDEEVEIRAMTIWAVEAMKKAFHDAGRKATSTQIDNWLWQLGQLAPFRHKPYHRCRTIYY